MTTERSSSTLSRRDFLKISISAIGGYFIKRYDRHIPLATPLPDSLLDQLAKKYSTGETIEIFGERRPAPTGLLLTEGGFTHKIVQQKPKESYWVSPQDLTAFRLPEYYSAHGILAERSGAGLGAFFEKLLHPNDNAVLFFGDGSYKNYQISQKVVLELQSLRNPNDGFKDPDNHGKILSVIEVFNRFYTTKDNLTLQTCSVDGRSRLFLVGNPV